MNADKIVAVVDEMQRYGKQIRFSAVGVEGQQRLALSRVVVIGCGALGTVSANLLVRAGIGFLTIVDRDFVELDNLQRQVLFDESDVGLPKAIVARQKLRQVNSQIHVDGIVADVDFRNIEQLLHTPQRADAVIDATDNFDVRFLINDACNKHGLTWIYAGCLGAEGQVMTVIPGETACLNCLLLEGPPPAGSAATCDTAGILSTIINVIAAIQVNEAIKWCSGNRQQMCRQLQVIDLWRNRWQTIDVSQLPGKVDCPTCRRREYRWLSGERGSQSTVLCGRNAVQVRQSDRVDVDLEALANRLAASGPVECNEYLLRLKVDDFTLTVFSDGRAIIHGTDDLSLAKKLYAQYVGH